LIVNVAGWLYIIQAGLTLLSLAGLSYLRGGQFGTLLLALAMGAIGAGLIKRLSWARWFALGTSFIGWTFGALILLGLLGLTVFAVAGANELFSAGTARGIGMVLAVVFFFTFAALVLGIVVNYKLFMHLVSDAGKQEFEAPDGSSAMTVLASSVAWVAIVTVTVGMTSGGRLTSALLARSLSADTERPADTGSARRDDAERAAALRREEARIEAARANERRRADNEAALLEAERNAAYDERIRSAELAARERASASVTTDNMSSATEDEDRPINKILKCQDPSGGVSYTQGYCPAGTKEVAAPRFE
jgi:hypothetical protein